MFHEKILHTLEDIFFFAILVLPHPSCLGQAHSNRPGTAPGYKNTKPGCILTALQVLSVICLLKHVDAKFGKVV